MCTGELCAVRDRLPTFESDDVQLLAVSCDPMFSLRAFADADGADLPAALRLLAARRGRPRRTASSTSAGAAPQRSTFIVDKEGVVRWAVHNAMPEARDLEEQAEVLAGAGAECPPVNSCDQGK